MLVDADSDGVNRIETQIINLNDDCFFEIFKYIPCIRKKILLRRVCKRFDEAVVNYFLSQPIRITKLEHLFYSSEIRPISSIKVELSLDNLLSSCPRVVTLNTLVFSRKIWWDLDKVTELPSLLHLVLHALNPGLSNENIRGLLKLCTNLTCLTLVDFSRGTKFPLDCLPKTIKKLEFINPSTSNHRIADITTYLSDSLVHLKIASSSSRDSVSRVKLDGQLISTIFEKCTKLERIHIEIPYDSVHPFVEVKNFKEIMLCCRGPTRHSIVEDNYTKIIANNPKLVKLHLPILSRDFFRFLKQTLIGCPDIQDVYTTYPQTEFDYNTIKGLTKQWQVIKRQFNDRSKKREVAQACDSLLRARLPTN